MYHTPRFASIEDEHAYFKRSSIFRENMQCLRDSSGKTGKELSSAIGFKTHSLNYYLGNMLIPDSERLETIRNYFKIEKVNDLFLPNEAFKRKYNVRRKEKS